jgi:ABC-2 type transport system permease protein
MVRAFRSELTKCGRWSILGGGLAMIVATAGWSFFVVNRAVHAGAMSRLLTQALPTTQGLITLIGAAEPFLMAIAMVMVTTNIAAEWSQGTLRNLLVREPGRLRLLAGKMFALLLLVTISAALALLAGAVVTLLAAQSAGISTTPWTSSDGINAFFRFSGNELLGLVGVSLLGMCIAVGTRSISASVGFSLAYVLVVERLIDAVWSEGAQWFPAHLFGYLPGVTTLMSYGAPPMGYSSDLAASLLWMTGFLLVSALLFRFRDVNV